jgi:hypothetical protein
MYANLPVHEKVDVIKRKTEGKRNNRQHHHERTPNKTKNYLPIELLSNERRRLEAE